MKNDINTKPAAPRSLKEGLQNRLDQARHDLDVASKALSLAIKGKAGQVVQEPLRANVLLFRGDIKAARIAIESVNQYPPIAR